MQFAYDGDLAANREIAHRIARRAAQRKTIFYSELVQGVSFHLPNVSGGSAFELGELGEWTDLDRRILGSVLGRISADSYAQARFLASAVAVSKTTSEPSEGFKDLVREAGFLRSSKADDFMLFWSEQLNKAFDWFESHPSEI